MSQNHILSAIDAEISRLQQVRALLAGEEPSTSKPFRRKYTLSAAARKRIAAAQRKRWAAVRKAK